jgi:hypothetical protein
MHICFRPLMATEELGSGSPTNVRQLAMEAKRAAFVLVPYPFSNEGRRNATNWRAIGVDKAPDTILEVLWELSRR